MSIKVMERVWERSGQKGSALLLLLALADNANQAGYCWPAIDTLSQKTRMEERHVRRLLDQLETAGEIYMRKGGRGRGRTNRYAVLSGLDATEIETVLRAWFGMTPLEASASARVVVERREALAAAEQKPDNLPGISESEDEKPDNLPGISESEDEGDQKAGTLPTNETENRTLARPEDTGNRTFEAGKADTAMSGESGTVIEPPREPSEPSPPPPSSPSEPGASAQRQEEEVVSDAPELVETGPEAEIAAVLVARGIFRGKAAAIAAKWMLLGVTVDEAAEIADGQLAALKGARDRRALLAHRLQDWDLSDLRADLPTRLPGLRPGSNGHAGEELSPEPPPGPDVWQRALAAIRPTMAEATFNAHLLGSELVQETDHRLVVAVRSAAAADWLANRLQRIVRTGVAEAAGRQLDVQYVVREDVA